MPHYRRVGHIPAKRHTHHLVDGERRFEELMGHHGFAGPSALLYHRHSPSAIETMEPIPDPVHSRTLTSDRPLVPRHIRTAKLDSGPDLVTGRTLMLGNDDVAISWVRATSDSPLYRNVSGDEIIFVQEGRLRLESVFGPLAAAPGDYVVVPSGTTHRWLVDEQPVSALVIESSGHVGPPDRYLGPEGQFLEHAPYCERDIRAPDQPLVIDETHIEVLVRDRAGWSRHVHANHPFDVDGWDGGLYPWALAISDFEPIVGSIHQPPPVHQTFQAPGMVVCSFVPRLFDFHPDAVKIPYHHANVDSDEVLFYSDGDFMSRKGSGIGAGSVSFHPAGFIHGPQPGSLEASLEADRTGETAVMIDTFSPLMVSVAARAASDPDYPATWLSS